MSLHFRSRFMMVIAAIFFIYAMLWALAPYSSFNLPARLILDISDWPLNNFTVPLDRNTQWLSSIAAGLLAALAIFFGGVVAPAIKQRNTVITRKAILAMVVWYIIDNAGSIASGVVSNVVFNSVYLALVLIPLIGVEQARDN